MTVLAACVIQLALAAPPVEPGSAPAALAALRAATVPPDGGIDAKKRAFAEQGSSDWMKRKPWTLDEWLKEVPPKLRPLVKEYFEKLERENRDKK